MVQKYSPSNLNPMYFIYTLPLRWHFNLQDLSYCKVLFHFATQAGTGIEANNIVEELIEDRGLSWRLRYFLSQSFIWATMRRFNTYLERVNLDHFSPRVSHGRNSCFPI